ncbi:MAG: hypothetical protein AB7L90_11265 [Hyphomicrobiaceae bacterium]
MPSRIVAISMALALGSGVALAQTSGSGGGSGGAASGGAASGAPTAPGSTATPGAPGASLGSPSPTTTQPRLGPAPDSTGERQRALTGPTSPTAPSATPSSPTLRSEQRPLGTGGVTQKGTNAGVDDPVVPPTAQECARGWQPNSRWRRDELEKYCKR